MVREMYPKLPEPQAKKPEKEGENPNEEGLCVQYMHMGTFDEEPRTVVLMGAYFEGNRPTGEDREIY